ncbi:MAG: hypothetical protein KBG29_04640 [Pseudomonadales bacterium]|jgi:hypothetical protein|nr:hypothetical protein [Pseudomonadales bacterium]MBP9033158.1 hypothetical protein [Pseudomonadales bacterium]
MKGDDSRNPLPPEAPRTARFSALHIDVARFATDDFNPFHDRNKWQRIEGNPFGGTIALGFQLTSFALHGVSMLHAAAPLRQRYLHVRVTFADAVRVDEDVELTIKPAQHGADGATVSHRIALRTRRSLALTGHVRFVPQAPGDPPLPVQAAALNAIRDRTEVPGTDYFLKRKFMSTANAKNFLLGANVDPAVYFDELEDRVRFTELFPVSLVSCALLERGTRNRHDFLQAPMVYSYHDIVVDRDVAMRLRSNDTLNMLVPAGHPPAAATSSGLRREQRVHLCLGYTGAGERLFSAEIGLVPLASLAC